LVGGTVQFESTVAPLKLRGQPPLLAVQVFQMAGIFWKILETVGNSRSNILLFGKLRKILEFCFPCNSACLENFGKFWKIWKVLETPSGTVFESLTIRKAQETPTKP
jgi:hypothetical protein